MLRLAPEVPKSDSPLHTQALWRRGCGARRHNPLHTRRRVTRTGSHRDGRQAVSRNAHPFPRHPIMPHANLSDLALLCDSSMTATITSTGWSITASSIYVAIFPIHHHHSSSLALVERRSSPSFRKCEILPATVGLQNLQSSHELIHRVLDKLIHRAFNEPTAYPTA